MGIFEFFKKREQDDPSKPKIRSKKDLVAYMKDGLGASDEIAQLVANAMDYAGRDCYIDFKMGGKGSPYHAEYQDHVKLLESISYEDLSKRIKQLEEMRSRAASNVEKEHIRKQIAEASGALVTIWINTGSEDDFNAKSKLIADVHRMARVALQI